MDADLEALAEAHGVATWYEDWHRERREVSAESVRAVLSLIGPAPEEQALPGTIVLRPGQKPPQGQIILEDGTPFRDGDLPLGWHTLINQGRKITLVVVPEKLPEPPETWGWMLQLYALRSTG